MKNNFVKRYLKVFVGNSVGNVVQKIDTFSKNNPVQILNYEILNSAECVNGTKILVFYAYFVPDEKESD